MTPNGVQAGATQPLPADARARADLAAEAMLELLLKMYYDYRAFLPTELVGEMQDTITQYLHPDVPLLRMRKRGILQ